MSGRLGVWDKIDLKRSTKFYYSVTTPENVGNFHFGS